jgi:hypothetical protein
MNDLHADFEPTWAPDGRSLVFATDRFTTSVATLDFGNYRLARLELASRRVTPLPGFDRATNINPQFAPDGSTIYFVANPNGIPNVYRLRLSNGAIAPVTNLSTGVTGITDVSPAISVARDSGRLAYTAYADRRFAIYGLDAGGATSVSSPDVNAAVLPSDPRRTPSALARTLARASVGLPSPSAEFPTTQYDPDLDLIYAGAAAGTSLGVDEVGTQLGAGISLLFSDILGTHLLGVTGEASGGVKDFGGRLEYLNQGSRWHWGGAVQRVPFRSGSGRQFLGQVDGLPAVIEQVEIFRQINNEVSLLTHYPFNRATRLEFSGGVRYIDFDHELKTRAFSPTTGGLIGSVPDL